MEIQIFVDEKQVIKFAWPNIIAIDFCLKNMVSSNRY